MLLLFLGASWVNPGSMRWCDTLGTGKKKRHLLSETRTRHKLLLSSLEASFEERLLERAVIQEGWDTVPFLHVAGTTTAEQPAAFTIQTKLTILIGTLMSSPTYNEQIIRADHTNSTDLPCWENTAKLERPCFPPTFKFNIVSKVESVPSPLKTASVLT